MRDGMLRIGVEDTRKWYDHFSLFSSGVSKITVCLPQAEYAALKIDEKTGDISLPEDFSFKSIHITVSTGRGKIGLNGEGLRLEAMNKTELLICGRLQSVEWE